MARERKTSREFEEVKAEMTPMIDVTFLLLIFFIVTLKFKTLEGRLDANLPKDRGTNTSEQEEIEKIDIIVRVVNPGVLIPDKSTATTSYPEGKLKIYSGRVVSYDVGAQSFRSAAEIKKFLENPAFDRVETPVSIDPRKDVVYGDVVIVLDVVINLKYEKISFAGSFEEE